MRRNLFIFILLAWQSASAQNPEDSLRKMEYEWLMAEFRCDTATISQMMDENFVAIGPKLSTKKEELEGIYSVMSKRKKRIISLIRFTSMMYG